MDRWEYQITTHSAGEVLRVRQELGAPSRPCRPQNRLL